MTRTAYLSNHAITWAAGKLVARHGEDAAELAQARAAEMARDGRFDLATIWEMVERTAGEMLHDAPAPAPVLH